MLLMDDFECRSCQSVFEELADRNAPETVKCPMCGQFNATRLIAAPRLDPRMGVDPAFATMGDRWVRKRDQQKKIEERRHREHGD
jgi:putative FmdB family regulatory protein